MPGSEGGHSSWKSRAATPTGEGLLLSSSTTIFKLQFLHQVPSVEFTFVDVGHKGITEDCVPPANLSMSSLKIKNDKNARF